MPDFGDFESLHMTCSAGSGFSQTAEFHILLWTGTKQSYYLLPICLGQAGKWKETLRASASAPAEAVSLVESAFFSLF